MPPTMPYHLETGVSLRALERYFNPKSFKRRVTRRVDALEALRKEPPDPLDDVLRDVIARHPPSAGDASILGAFATNVQSLWLGIDAPRQAGEPRTDRVYDSDVTPGGGWLHYRGMSECILRTTLIRGLAASLEAGEGADCITTAHPIVFIWKCAQAWLEGWVQWRTVNRRRTVVVIICTPGDGNHISMKPTMGYLEAGAPGGALRSAVSAGFSMYPTVAPSQSVYAMTQALPANESIVITESAHELTPLPASSTTTTPVAVALARRPVNGVAVVNPATGALYAGAPLPWFGGRFSPTADAHVVTVSPALYDGGVD
jgi:hypothetical protein